MSLILPNTALATAAELTTLTNRVANYEAATAAALKVLTDHLALDDVTLAKLTAAITPVPIIIPPIVAPPYDPQIQWSASFEGGNLFEFEGQNNSGAASSSAVLASGEGIAAHSGLWVMKQSVTGIGGTRMYRYSTINNIYRTGNPIYYSFWAYFPQITTLGAGGFFSLLQVQSINPSNVTDPVWILGLHPSAFTLRMEWWGNLAMEGPHPGETGGKAYDQLTPIPTGKWTFIEVMVTPREDFSGAVKVWQDKALLFDISGVKTKYPESFAPAGAQSFHISKNAYGQAINPLPHAHYVDDVTISLARMP